MKKVISLVLMFSMLLTSVSALAYTDRRTLPEGSDANYLPYAENMTTTRYTPWYKAYHMQTAADAENGIRGGEGGQVVTCFGVSPVCPNYVMFGVDTSGAWLSHDGGTNWYQLREGSYTWAVTDIQWHPKYERVVYMAQACSTGIDSSAVKKANRTEQDGIWRSRDAGITWEQVISSNVISSTGTDTLICFDDNNNVYCLTSNGIMKSTDDGDTFNCIAKLMYTDDETKPFYTTDYNNPDYTAAVDKYLGTLYVSPDGKTIIAGGYGGFDISRDGGANWSKIEAFGYDTGYSFAVNPLDAKHWIAITGGGSKVYKSFDAGYTWEAMSFYKYNNGKYYPVTVRFSYPKNGKTNIHMIFKDMTIPYAYSTDMGATWKKPVISENDRYTAHYKGYTCEGFTVCEADPDLMFFSFGDIVYKSTNGGVTYEISCSGFSGNYVRQFYFDKYNRIWMAFTDKGLGVTDVPYDGKILPTGKMAGVTGTCASVLIDPNNEKHIFASSGDWYTQTMKVTFDGGNTWSNIEGADTEVPWELLVYDLEDKNTIYSSLYTSHDNGVTWEANDKRYDAISTLNDDIRFSINRPDSKYFSYTLDGGETWTEKRVSSGVSTILPDLFDENKFYIGHSAGWISIFTIKEDGTCTYTTKKDTHGIVDTSSSEQKAMVNVLAQNPKDKNHIVAGVKCTNAGVSSHGIVETRDGGNTWYPVPGARGPMTIYELEFSPVSNEIFIGNCSGGTTVYEYDNYSNENEIHFDIDSSIAETKDSVTGKYGEKHTIVAPKMIDENYEFSGYEYDAEEFIGNGKTKRVRRLYKEGQQIDFSYKDIMLTAKFVRKNTAPNFVHSVSEYVHKSNALHEMVNIGDEWYLDYINQKDAYYEIGGNNSVYYSIDISGGLNALSGKVTIGTEGVSDKGTLKIYGFDKDFKTLFKDFSKEVTQKQLSITPSEVIYEQELDPETFDGVSEFDITAYANSLVEKGLRDCVIKLEYVSGSDSKMGLSYLSWYENAVRSEMTYDVSYALTKLDKTNISISAVLPKGTFAQPVIGIYERENPTKLVKLITKEKVELNEKNETFYRTQFDASLLDVSDYYVKFFVISDFGDLTPVTFNSTLE